MTLNVLHGALGRERPVADVVRAIQPHVAVFTEARDTRAFAAVTELVGLHRVLSGEEADRERVMIVSRWPIDRHERCGPPWSRSKWIKATTRPFDGPPLTVVGACLTPQLLWPFELLRRVEVGALLDAAANSGEPRVLAGDFNALSPGDRHRLKQSPWWVRAQWLSQAGLIPRWAMSRVTAAGYVDCYRTCHSTEEGFTVPAWDPQARIDYLFASSGLRSSLRAAGTQPSQPAGERRPMVRRTIAELLGTRAVSSLNGEASDHLAVWAEFDWPVP